MNIDEIASWFNSQRTPILSQDDAVALLASAHPRTQFVKTLPREARLLDIGAGDGGLQVLRKWPAPARTDLKIYAYSRDKGAHFDAYDGFELGDWNVRPPSFPDVDFTALLAAHFIEYLADPVPFAKWAAQRLGHAGRLYLEWPSPFSTLLPKRSELAQRGITLMISNVHDDDGNKVIHGRSKIVALLSDFGFFIEHHGYVSLPLLEDELLAHAARGLADAYAVQSAFWSKTKWAQYIVAVRK